MSQDFAIRARGLSKKYRLGVADAHDSLRDLLVSGARALAGGALGKRAERREFYALRDATFDIKRGENVGIIGANGAGKSTLLKILSRITEPTTGEALIRGRLGALLEVGTGFHQELTGRENVFLYGSILGMSRSEVAAKFDAIVAFAEIENFIDTPVKRYSSGMYVRLAFSVAAHLQPDILLLDEVLAVGDLAFQRKCFAFAKELQQREATILFVSHNMFSIKSMCSRAIVLKAGEVVFDGPTDQGIAKYEEHAALGATPWFREGTENSPIILTAIEILNDTGESANVFELGARMHIKLHYHARREISAPLFHVAFVRSDGVTPNVFVSDMDGLEIGCIDNHGVIELQTPPLKLIAEKYTIHVLIRQGGSQELLCAQVGHSFHIKHPLLDTRFGTFHEPAHWRHLPAPQVSPNVSTAAQS